MSEYRRWRRFCGLLVRSVPVLGALALAYGLGRFAPYWRLGVNRLVWWFALFALANTVLVLLDKATRAVSGKR